MEFGVIIVVMIIVAVVVRIAAGGLDEDRVKQEIEAKGGKLLSKEWSPFGKGWFGEKNDRIYEVRYLDSEGNEHEAYVKTSMFSGVYFTEDKIVKYAEKDELDPTTELMQENERLRAELEKLKKKEKK